MKRPALATLTLALAASAAVAAEVPYFRFGNPAGVGKPVTVADPELSPPDPVGNTDPSGIGLRYESVQGMAGQPFLSTPVARNVAEGKARYTLVSGSLPGFLTLNPDTGVISGNPQGTGTYALGIQVEEQGSGRKVAVPVEISIVTRATVADALARITYGGEDVTGYIHDASNDTALTTTAGGGPITYSYDVPRLADQLNIGGNPGAWTFEALSSSGAWVRLASGAGQGYHPFPATAASEFRLSVGASYLQVTGLLYQGGYQYAPTVNRPAAESVPLGSGLATVLSAGYVQGDPSWSVVGGALPDGISLSPDGSFSGAATRYGSFMAQVAVRDARTRSAPVPFTVTVSSPHSVKDNLPVTASKGSVAALYDADAGADSVVSLAANDAVVLGYDRAVRANGLALQGSHAGLTLEYLEGQTWRSLGTVAANGTALAYPEATSTQWRITSVGPAILGTARVTDGGAAPLAPSVDPVSVNAEAGSAAVLPLQASNATAPLSYALASGSWPEGLSMGPDGVLRGTPTAAAETSVKVTVTDARGVTSVARTIPVKVVVPARTYARWDAAKRSASITVSADGATATGSLNGTWQNVLADTGKSAGKWYFEVATSSPDATIGLSPVLASAVGKQYAGDVGTGGITIYTRRGQILVNNAQVGPSAYGSLQGTVMVAWDGAKIWFGLNGTWLNGNPGMGAGGTAYAPGNTVYPSFDTYFAGAANGGTGKFAPASLSYAVPNGFSAWYR